MKNLAVHRFEYWHSAAGGRGSEATDPSVSGEAGLSGGGPRRAPPYRRKRGSRRKLVFGLPRRADRSTHRVQEGVDVLAAERRRRVPKHALAVVPMHGPAARLGGSREDLAI